MSLDERPRGSTWPTPKVHYNSLPRTSIEGALGDTTGMFVGWITGGWDGGWCLRRNARGVRGYERGYV